MATRSPVQILAVGGVALVIGLALGGLAPRAQLRALEAQVARLQETDCTGNGIGRQLATALSGQPWKAALSEDQAELLSRPSPTPEPDSPDSEPTDNSVINIEIGGDDLPEDFDPDNIDEALILARDAISMRRAQARAALEDDARPSEQQWTEIDQAIHNMNDDLAALAEGFVADIGTDQEPSRRDAMIFAADTLDVILEADDAIYGSLDEDQRAAVDEQAIDPLSYLDEGLMDIFMELDR